MVRPIQEVRLLSTPFANWQSDSVALAVWVRFIWMGK